MTKIIKPFLAIITLLIFLTCNKQTKIKEEVLSITEFKTQYGNISLKLPSDTVSSYIYRESLFCKSYDLFYKIKSSTSISINIYPKEEEKRCFFNDNYLVELDKIKERNDRLFFTEIDTTLQSYRYTSLRHQRDNLGVIFIIYNHFTNDYCYEVMILGEDVDFNNYPMMREIIESIEITPK